SSLQAKQSSTQQMERLPNRYPKISQSHKVPLYKGLSLFYPKLRKKYDFVVFFFSGFLLVKGLNLYRT
ncbi:hypothetical protein CLI85_08595, partial [Tannerella forsythia]